MNSAGATVSKEFFDLIKAIGEARSKQEEDRIITDEIVKLKTALSEPNIPLKKMQEYIVRSLYVELLGHDASFAHFKAVEITNQSQNIKAKRLGYLACNLFLSEDNELMLLLINTIQKDLSSPNILVVQAALHGVTRLLTFEMLPALLPSLNSLLQHPHASIRKKTVMAFHKVATLRSQLHSHTDSLLLLNSSSTKNSSKGNSAASDALHNNDSESSAGTSSATSPVAYSIKLSTAAAAENAPTSTANNRSNSSNNSSSSSSSDSNSSSSSSGSGSSSAVGGGGSVLLPLCREKSEENELEDIVEGFREKMCRALCDIDPSVMAASLHVIHRLAQTAPAAWRDIVPSLVSILRQIIDKNLPKDYEYHRVCAPWIQIKLLSLLACLAGGEQRASEEVYGVLFELLKRHLEQPAWCTAAAFAVTFECIRTAAALYPQPQLLAAAGNSVSRFLAADFNNLRCCGIKGLAAVVQVAPAACAAQQQLLVVDCLEDSDETLKRKTLDLLVQITNPLNVQVVVQKLLDHLRSTTDSHMRRDLLNKITTLAERYSPDARWFLETILLVLQVSAPSFPYKNKEAEIEEGCSSCSEEKDGLKVGKDELACVPFFFFTGRESGSTSNVCSSSSSSGTVCSLALPVAAAMSKESSTSSCEDTAYALLQLIADGPMEDEVSDKMYRSFAVEQVLSLLLLQQRRNSVPDLLMQVVAWVLGEFGGACASRRMTQTALFDLLCSCIDRGYDDPCTKAWVVWSIVKLCVYWKQHQNNTKSSSSGGGGGVGSGLINGIAEVAFSGEEISASEISTIPLRVLQQFQQQPKQLATCTEVQERCFRGLLLLQMLPPHLLKEIFPVDASTEDIRVDPKLPFLDEFVQQSILAGGGRYIPANQRTERCTKQPAAFDLTSIAAQKTQTPSLAASLKFTPYAPPLVAPVSATAESSSHHFSFIANNSSGRSSKGSPRNSPVHATGDANLPEEANGVFQVQGPRRWGPSGYRAGAKAEKFEGATTASRNSSSSSSSSQGGLEGFHSRNRWSTTSTATANAAEAATENAAAVSAACGSSSELFLSSRERIAAALFKGTLQSAPLASSSSSSQFSSNTKNSSNSNSSSSGESRNAAWSREEESLQVHAGEEGGNSKKAAASVATASSVDLLGLDCFSPSAAAPASALPSSGFFSGSLLLLQDKPVSSQQKTESSGGSGGAPPRDSSNSTTSSSSSVKDSVGRGGGERRRRRSSSQSREFVFSEPPLDSLLSLGGLVSQPLEHCTASPSSADFTGVEAVNKNSWSNSSSSRSGSSSGSGSGGGFDKKKAPVLSLRPLRISTEEVGAQWTSLSGEAVANCSNVNNQWSDVSDCQSFISKVLQKKLSIYVVEVIGDEAIAAATSAVRVSGEEERVFLHIQFKDGSASFIVKASSPELAQAVASVCDSL